MSQWHAGLRIFKRAMDSALSPARLAGSQCRLGSVCDRDESPDQGMLSVVQQILMKTHAEVMSRFSAVTALQAADRREQAIKLPGWDVRLVLSYLRSQVSTKRI